MENERCARWRQVGQPTIFTARRRERADIISDRNERSCHRLWRRALDSGDCGATVVVTAGQWNAPNPQSCGRRVVAGWRARGRGRMRRAGVGAPIQQHRRHRNGEGDDRGRHPRRNADHNRIILHIRVTEGRDVSRIGLGVRPRIHQRVAAGQRRVLMIALRAVVPNPPETIEVCMVQPEDRIGW